MASLLLAAPNARAGSYTITYSGGASPTVTPAADGNGYAYMDASTDKFAAAGASVSPMGTFGTSPYTIQANPGAALVTATFTWVPASGLNMTTDPPPASVLVEQDSTALWYVITQYDTASSSGLVDCGLPGATVTPFTYNAPLPSNGLSATLYSVQPAGASFSVSCNPTASFTGTTGTEGKVEGEALVQWEASIPPVSVSFGAHSTVDTSAPGNPWDPAHPRFFSGTNCSASATAPAISGYVSHAQLQVGGTDVKDYYDTSDAGHPAAGPNVILGTNQTSASLSVHFDSTYFPNGSPIPIQLTVTDTNGKTYNGQISGPACNNLLALANQTSSWVDYNASPPVNVAEEAMDGTTPIAGVVQQSGPNNIAGVGKDSDHKADIITDIAGNSWTAFFAATHSEQGELGDCYSTPTSDLATTYLFDADIQGAIAIRTTALYPPYLFAHIHGCNGGGSSALANDFGIASASSDDRACVAYDATIVVNQQNTNFALLMWQLLLSGEKVSDAVKDALATYKVQVWQDFNIPPDNQHVTIPKIYGDSTMTLHNKVYSWVSGPTWYR